MNKNPNTAANTAKTTAIGIKSACAVDEGGAPVELKSFNRVVAPAVKP